LASYELNSYLKDTYNDIEPIADLIAKKIIEFVKTPLFKSYIKYVKTLKTVDNGFLTDSLTKGLRFYVDNLEKAINEYCQMENVYLTVFQTRTGSYLYFDQYKEKPNILDWRISSEHTYSLQVCNEIEKAGV